MGAGRSLFGSAWYDDFTNLADVGQAAQTLLRLLIAASLGAVVGWQREWAGKAAGLRTHMLVAIGAALFVVVPIETGMDQAAVSRVIQGLVAGIGFLGAGAIVKEQSQERVHGLTTAADIWMTAAIGVAAGLGRLAAAALGTGFVLLILTVIHRLDEKLRHGAKRDAILHPHETDNKST